MTRDRRTLTKTLLSQGNALQLLQAVSLGSAVDDGVLEELSVDALVVDCRLNPAAAVVLHRRLQFPGVPPLVMDEAGVVVTLVQVL